MKISKLKQHIAWLLAGFILSTWILTFFAFHKPISPITNDISQNCEFPTEERKTAIVPENGDQDFRNDQDQDEEFESIRILSRPMRSDLCEKLGDISFDETISMIIVNEKWIEFAQNLLCSLNNFPKFSRLGVINMDDPSMAWCISQFPRTACFRAPFYQPRGSDAVYMTGNFLEIGVAKMNYVYEAQECGFVVYFFDLDLAVLKDPDLFLPQKYVWEGTCDQEKPKDEITNRNIGFFRLDNSPIAKSVIRETLLRMARDPRNQDQFHFNQIMDSKNISYFCMDKNVDGQHCHQSDSSEWRNEIVALHGNCMSGSGNKKGWLQYFSEFPETKRAWNQECIDKSMTSSKSISNIECPMNMGFAIFSRKDTYLTRARAIQRTWGESLSQNLVFFVDEQISDLETPKETVYSFSSASGKLKKSFFFTEDTGGYKVVILPEKHDSDHDIFVDILRIMKWIFPQQSFFGFFEDSEYIFLEYLCHHWIDKLDPKISQYFGRPDREIATVKNGLFLSNHLLRTILPNLENCKTEFEFLGAEIESRQTPPPSDLFLWKCVEKYGAPSVSLNPWLWGMQPVGPTQLFAENKDIRKSDDVALGFRDVSPDEMQKIHKLFLESKKNGQRLTYKKLFELL